MLSLFISIIPAFLLALYIYNKDSVKEPKSLLIGLFASGFLAAVLAVLVDIIIYFFLPDYFLTENYKNFGFFKLFCITFLEIALVEEFCKWIMLRIFAYNHKDFDQFFDIIVYSVFVSLGFATIENLFYVIPGGFSLGVLRAFFSIPGHASFGVFMGLFLGLSKFYEKRNRVLHYLYMGSAVLIPTLFHTVYDFCIFTENIWLFIVFLVFIITLYIITIVEINQVSKGNQSL